MRLCKVHIEAFTQEEKEILDLMFFHPYDKLEEHEGKLIMNYGTGEDICRGINDFEEDCKKCRYVPFVVRRILKRQEQFRFGKASIG